MLKLTQSLSSWNTEQFKQAFVSEVANLSLEQLPLQQAMRIGNSASKHNLNIMINRLYEDEDSLYIRSGIFFSSIISGCSCADDPTPVDYNTEYAELLFRIDRKCAEAHISIIDDD